MKLENVKVVEHCSLVKEANVNTHVLTFETEFSSRIDPI